MQAARQLLLSLFDGALAGGAQLGGRGLGGGRGGGRWGSTSRPREGEWACLCGFDTNRPRRDACFRCGRSRDVAEVRGGGGGAKGFGKGRGADGKAHRGAHPREADGGCGKGPVGAGGSRPLLGGRGRGPLGGAADGDGERTSPQPPMGGGKGSPGIMWPARDGDWPKAGFTANGKGDSKGKRGPEDSATREQGTGKGSSAWRRPQAVVDEDGYELVQPRRVRAGKSGGQEEGGGATATKGGGRDVAWATTTRRRWTDVDDSDDDDVGDEELEEQHDDVGVDGEGGAEVADPRQLRSAYEEHARAAKDLERRGIHGPALETLRAARDAAERRWREAKPPAPLSKRLEWADTKLRKAQATLARVRLELDEFDEATERKRAELCRKVQEAQEWCQWRRRQLDDVHGEAAETAPGRRGTSVESGGTAEVRQRIRGYMLPEMQAIMEGVPEGTELRERLALFAAGLADAETRLGTPQEVEGPTCFHMGDDESRQEDWDDGYQEMEDGRETREDGPEGCKHDAARASEWRPEGIGRWTKTGTSGTGGRLRGASGTSATATTTTRALTTDGDVSANGPTGKGATAGDQPAATASGGATGGDADVADGDGARAGKHRRLQTTTEAAEAERAASDSRRAQELQRQLEQASAAQEQSYRSGLGGFGSQAALSTAAQSFVMHVQRVQAQASEMGVEPKTQDGRMLLELSPAELEQWVQENLGDDGMCD